MVKPIKNFEELYLACEDGRIYSTRRKKYLAPAIQNSGYCIVCLCKDGKLFMRTVHRLIADTFLGEHPELEVNHKDENKLNNALSNLEFLTHKENINYGTCMARRVESLKKTRENNKKLK